MFDFLKRLAFQHRRLLAGLWLSAIALLGGGLWAYVAFVPDDIDTGIAVAARAWFYRRTFAEVEQARRELESGQPDVARRRLERFLAARRDVQPAQLWTHAVIDAGKLLARIGIEQGNGKRAAESITPLLERLPLEYQLWWAQGRALAADGSYAEAAAPLRRAFTLTLHHAGVLEDYLASMNEINTFADVAWAADEHERARARATPHLLLKVGIPRPKLERWGLSAVGIPVEHGRFFRHLERFDGERGPGRRILFPPEMFEPWRPEWSDELVVHLRMENVFDGFTVDGMEITRRDGDVLASKPAAGKPVQLTQAV